MVRNFVLYCFACAFISCSSYIRLENGTTKVPPKFYEFANKKRFNANIYDTIDISYIYELKELYFTDKKFNILKKYEVNENNTKLLQFYKNGNVRRGLKGFFTPNPNHDGYRGVVYYKNEKIKIDFFDGYANNKMGIRTYLVKVKENKLYLYTSEGYLGLNYDCFVFEKQQKITKEYLDYQADW